MVKIKLTKAFEVDNDVFEKWCVERKIGKWKGRVFIRKKMYESGEAYLSSQTLINKKTDLK